MLTPNFRAASMAWCVFTDFSMHTRTSGGCRESEANDATVIPNCIPSCSVVTTVTPLAQWDMASLNAAPSPAIEGRSVAQREENDTIHSPHQQESPPQGTDDHDIATRPRQREERP